MKKSKLFLTMLFCGVCVTNCNSQSVEQKKISDDQSSNNRELKLDPFFFEKRTIKEFYDKFIFKQETFDSISATPYCSKNLIKYLGELFHEEFDTNVRGYAIWDFSVAWQLDLPETDMNKPSTITAIEDLGNQWFKVSLNEHGYTGIIKIKVIRERNKYVLDDFDWIERGNF
jgi:hypothetical protein